jgi:hypothetical protein
LDLGTPAPSCIDKHSRGAADSGRHDDRDDRPPTTDDPTTRRPDDLATVTTDDLTTVTTDDLSTVTTLANERSRRLQRRSLARDGST